MKKLKGISFILSAVIAISFVLVSIEANACTGIRIKTQDGNYIFGRTMEFSAGYIAHKLIFIPRNYKYTGHTPSDKPGMIWKAKYAHVGFDPSSIAAVDDGLNEKGVYCGGFFHPGYAKYEEVSEKDYSSTIANIDVVSWILTNFASVSEAREQLPKVHVCAVVLAEMGYVPPLHYFVADKTGDAIIIEYLDGKLKIYENELNVITNAPGYAWHAENFRNYIGLKPDNNPAIKINDKEFARFSQGSGAIGLPGDFSAPSRFIRAAFIANSVFPGKDVDEGIGVAFHIMNQFDIPPGVARGEEFGKPVYETTQWTSVSDLTNCRYFYNTYNDRSLRVIDFNKLDLNAPDVKVINDVQKPGKIEDVSGKFK